MPKKKMWANFRRIIELFTEKIVTKLSKIWVWDPESRIHGQKCTGSRIRICNTDRNEEPLPVEDAECTEEDEGGEEARRTPRILLIQPPDIRVRHVHAAQFQEIICSS